MASEFSKTLALLRKERGVSQRTAAGDLGVSQALSGDLDVPSALQYVYDAWEEITDEQGRDTQLQFYHNTYASVTTGTGVS